MKLYHSAAWLKVRVLVLPRDPVCMICKEQPSTVVDHIKPMADGGEALDLDNLQGLCKRCHDQKTAREDGGFGR